ncbi:hypothetical protein QYF61_006974, partial [Mycteria americana]
MPAAVHCLRVCKGRTRASELMPCVYEECMRSAEMWTPDRALPFLCVTPGTNPTVPVLGHKEDDGWVRYHVMRGFTAGGTTEYRTATARSRDGEKMEGGFRQATMAVLINRETTA